MKRNSGFLIESAFSSSFSSLVGTCSSHLAARSRKSFIHCGTAPATSALSSSRASRMVLSSSAAFPVSTSCSSRNCWHMTRARGGSPTSAGLFTTSSSVSSTHLRMSWYLVLATSRGCTCLSHGYLSGIRRSIHHIGQRPQPLFNLAFLYELLLGPAHLETASSSETFPDPR